MAVFNGTNSDDIFNHVDTDADDVFYGFGGDDQVMAGLGNDTLNGDDGDDVLSGGSGADVIDGYSGFDYLAFDNAASGVFVDLDAGVGHGGDAEGDVYYSIEHVSGTAYDDRLLADLHDIAVGLAGMDGDDTLYGNGRDNSLLGGPGDDRLVGGKGADELTGGAGIDWAYYHFACENRNRTYVGAYVGGNLANPPEKNICEQKRRSTATGSSAFKLLDPPRKSAATLEKFDGSWGGI